MNVTRQVIQDLLPLYLAGEASEDTRLLVESYLAQDVELAEWVRQQGKTLVLPTFQENLPKETQMKTLEQTKTMLRKRAWYMAFAILFTGFTLMFRFDNHLVITWVWADAPRVAPFFAVVASWFWLLYIISRRQTSATNL